MTPGGIRPGPEGTYLARARDLRARGESLGARLVAWSAAVFVLAWDESAIEPAVLVATSIRGEAYTTARAWACGIAEGALDPIAPGEDLAWGEALLAAASLARIARPGEVLLDGDVRAIRAGQLQVVGVRTATDAGRRVRGWQLELEQPWKVAETVHVEPAARTGPTDDDEEISSAEILQIVDDSCPRTPRLPRSDRPRRIDANGANPGLPSLRDLFAAGSASVSSAVAALPGLRRARAEAEVRDPGERCRTSLALALALSVAGRTDEALLEGLDALARAREAGSSRAVVACRALLAKVYARAGRREAASLITGL